MTRVLICGGRDFSNYALLHATLTKLDIERVFTSVITGGARGADDLGRMWAHRRAIPVTEYPANWTKHGKAAGPIRNQLMLDEAKPDLVVAFPGGAGTADMVRRARQAGVEVVEVKV